MILRHFASLLIYHFTDQHLVSYISIMHKAFIYTLYTYIYNRFCQRDVNNLYSKIQDNQYYSHRGVRANILAQCQIEVHNYNKH